MTTKILVVKENGEPAGDFSANEFCLLCFRYIFTLSVLIKSKKRAENYCLYQFRLTSGKEMASYTSDVPYLLD